MKDSECVHFLQWSLPQLRMQWPGFRKVRSQVCKRLQRRLDHLHLNNLSDYRRYLEEHREEWVNLDQLCQITISRFYRDKMVFTFLEKEVFPKILHSIKLHGQKEIRIWCAGSGSGEEPYTLALLWAMCFESRFPEIKLSIVATEIKPEMIDRARQACYPFSSIKNLPKSWQQAAFYLNEDQYCLRHEFCNKVSFLCQDLREEAPADNDSRRYHLICCRNLAFTYFDTSLQLNILKRLETILDRGGALIIGVHEKLPLENTVLVPWSERLGIYHHSPETL